MDVSRYSSFIRVNAYEMKEEYWIDLGRNYEQILKINNMNENDFAQRYDVIIEKI